MLTMDVFNSDPFSAINMTAAVERLGYVPTFLQTVPGLVKPVPVNTEHIWIEARGNAPALIQTSVRGTAPKRKGGDRRTAQAFKTHRLALAAHLEASELQNFRAFGTTTELMSLQTELARRIMLVKQDFQLTRESWYLGMVQGKLVDADGQTVLNDWAEAFDQPLMDEINFTSAFGNDTGAVRKLGNKLKRTMAVNLKGLGGAGWSIGALCGADFWDDFTGCEEVRKTYLNWSEAKDLRKDVGAAWSSFSYGDINWHDYRGSDGSEVAIGPKEVRFFPMGAGIFQEALAPAERFEFVNTPGKDMYSWMVIDRDRNMWADAECYSYPLPVCVQPSALGSGKIS